MYNIKTSVILAFKVICILLVLYITPIFSHEANASKSVCANGSAKNCPACHSKKQSSVCVSGNCKCQYNPGSCSASDISQCPACPSTSVTCNNGACKCADAPSVPCGKANCACTGYGPNSLPLLPFCSYDQCTILYSAGAKTCTTASDCPCSSGTPVCQPCPSNAPVDICTIGTNICQCNGYANNPSLCKIQ